MKRFGFLLFSLVMVACNQPGQPGTDEGNVVQHTTVIRYQPVDTTVVRSDTNLVIVGKRYHLAQEFFCLNDSTLSMTHQPRNPDESELGHHYASRLCLLTREGDTVVSAMVSKANLRDRLSSEYNLSSTLLEVRYEAAFNNRLFFTVVLHVPGVGEERSFKMALFYATEQKGELVFW